LWKRVIAKTEGKIQTWYNKEISMLQDKVHSTACGGRDVPDGWVVLSTRLHKLDFLKSRRRMSKQCSYMQNSVIQQALKRPLFSVFPLL
jgi:hypothetical protein